MANCTFCGTVLRRGTGKMYVKKDGRILHFCSMKCEKNMLVLNRKPLTTAWTNDFHKVKAGVKSAKK